MLYSSTPQQRGRTSERRASDMRTLTKGPSVNAYSFARVCLRRSLCAFMLACLLPVVVAAYTIVLRGGRRIEAPDNFSVTQATLTYEAAPGLNVTLPLAEIDIAATERANNEAPGSLLRRASAPQATARRVSNAPRPLTNRELEPLRHARLERERAAAERRKELGLPPVPQVEQRSADEELMTLREIARQHEAEEAQAENYWRTRAESLRTEIAVLDAEINFLRARLAESSNRFSNGFVVGPSINPFFAARPFPFAAAPGSFNTNTFGTRTQFAGRLTFGGGTTRGTVSLNQQSGTFHRRIIGAPRVFASPFVVAVPFNYVTADE